MVKNSIQNGNKVSGIRVLSEMKTINTYISQTSQIQHKSLPIGELCWGAENANINYSCIYQNSATKYIAKHEQKLIMAAPADPRSCNRNGHIQIEHKYWSECIESDSRLWRYSSKCGYSRELIYCPDTDAYMIGLTNHTKSTDIVVELTPIGSKDRKLLPMNELTIGVGT